MSLRIEDSHFDIDEMSLRATLGQAYRVRPIAAFGEDGLDTKFDSAAKIPVGIPARQLTGKYEIRLDPALIFAGMGNRSPFNDSDALSRAQPAAEPLRLSISRAPHSEVVVIDNIDQTGPSISFRHRFLAGTAGKELPERCGFSRV